VIDTQQADSALLEAEHDLNKYRRNMAIDVCQHIDGNQGESQGDMHKERADRDKARDQCGRMFSG